MPITFFEGTAIRTAEAAAKLKVDPYIPPPNLIEAVKLAQILKRPLLVKGEPGCGKSRLAEAIAAEFFGPTYGEHFRDYLFEWNVKSTSKAVEGLYTINNLQRLSDANIGGVRNQKLAIQLPKDTRGNYKARGNYIDLGQLGQAFLMSHDPSIPYPPVVLIDEIDKADIDFPNDLLYELDRMKFDVPEIIENGKPVRITANEKMPPLFIITSNDEKPLPAAFLRRCLFHYIKFEDIDLTEIVNRRFPRLAPQTELVSQSIAAFTKWRDKIEKKGTSTKNISTSELLDWIKLIEYYTAEGKTLRPDGEGMPPYYQALLKDPESIKIFAKPVQAN